MGSLSEHFIRRALPSLDRKILWWAEKDTYLQVRHPFEEAAYPTRRARLFRGVLGARVMSDPVLLMARFAKFCSACTSATSLCPLASGIDTVIFSLRRPQAVAF
jgi:hypothetical protein